jgi:hypothetical protein
MMSVAAVALIAGAGFANAQGTGTGTPSAGSSRSAERAIFGTRELGRPVKA